MMETFWAELEEEDCPCQGIGWHKIEVCFHQCPIHYVGQLHPEHLSIIKPENAKEEERKSRLRWKIDDINTEIVKYREAIMKLQEQRTQLELEIIQKSPTVRMNAVRIPKAAYPSSHRLNAETIDAIE